MTTFQAYKDNPTSEKLVLALVEPSQRLFGWSLYSENIYSRSVDFYAVSVRQDAVLLTEVDSLANLISAGQWYFDPLTAVLYVRSTGDVSPSAVWTDVTFRLCFSNGPINLPIDLDAGTEVPYDPRIYSLGKFKSNFDADQKGVALEGSGKLTLENTDGFFMSIYDRYIWENKTVTIYSYNRNIALSEKRRLFSGVITNKSYSASRVSFDIKDFMYKLRSPLDLPIYIEEDGRLPQSLLGKPKRRAYGRVDGLLVDPADNMYTGYIPNEITDDARNGTEITFNTTSGSPIITASSADVHKEVVAGDTIVIRDTKYKVKSLSRIDVGLDSPADVTLSRVNSTTARITFDDIDTSSVTVGDFITLSRLSNASQDTKSKVLGQFVIAAKTSTAIDFILPVSIATLADVFETDVGEVAITRQSNTGVITLQSEVPFSSTNESCTIEPLRPYRRFNRDWIVAHHALSTVVTTITSVISAVKFAVGSVAGMYEGDLIRVNGGRLSTIAGININARTVTVTDTLLPFPVIGQSVERLGVQRVTYDQRSFTSFTDFIPTFDSLIGSKLTFDYLAEFNAAPIQSFNIRLNWLNGSHQVLGTNDVFKDIQVRDWVKSDTDDGWYEVAEKFSNNLIILDVPYTGTSGRNTTLFKAPNYITDSSKIIVDIYGKTVDGTEQGEFLSTGSEIVRDLLIDAGLGDRINEPSFTLAKTKSPYLISMVIPAIKASPAPKIRDIVNEINTSVFGSVYTNISNDIEYRVLDASRLLDNVVALTDVDILDHSVKTDSTKMLKKVLVRYRSQDADIVTQDPTYKVQQSESAFVPNSGIDALIETVQSVLYRDNDALILAQRILFINGLSSSQVTLKTKLILAEAVLNDLVMLDLDRLYNRLGSVSDNGKLGLISSISKDGLEVTAIVDDLGNMFNRVAVIADNTAPNFSLASTTDRRFAGYIADANGVIDDSGDTFHINKIG